MHSMSKKFIGGILLAIALVAIGLFWQTSIKERRAQEEQLQIEVKRQQTVDSYIQLEKTVDITTPTVIDTDMSYWKTYQNDKYGYAFKYPQDWILTEIDEETPLQLLRSQYVLVQSKDKNFNFEIGVKLTDENSVMNKPFRTGVGAEDIKQSNKSIPINGVNVEKVYLNYYYRSIDTNPHLQEIWFCPLGSSELCNDLKIGDDNLLYVQVKINPSISDERILNRIGLQWNIIEKVADAMVASIHFEENSK